MRKGDKEKGGEEERKILKGRRKKEGKEGRY